MQFAPDHIVIAGATHAGRMAIKTVMLPDETWAEVVMLRRREGKGEREEILMRLEKH